MTFTTTRPSIDIKIQRRPAIKARVIPRFPARVQASDGLEVTISGNVYTFGEDFASLTELGAATLASTYLKVLLSGTYYNYPLTTLIDDIATEILAEFMTPQVIAAAGGYTVGSTDHYLVFNKTVGEATAATLPASTGRTGPLTIKDGKGDAATNNITITPDGAETIDGLASWVLNFAYQGVTLVPRPDGNGWWTR